MILDEIDAFIAGRTWRTATSRWYKHLPHQYTVRRPGTFDEDPDFAAFARHIRENGYTRTFGAKRQVVHYVTVDEYEYWVMPGPLEDTGVINRQTLAQRDAHLARTT